MRHTLIFIVLVLMIAPKAAWADKTTVKSFQMLLSSGGYLTDSVDGIIGPKTISAYNNFAVENGFPQKSSLSVQYVKKVISKLSRQTGIYTIDYFHNEITCDSISKTEANSTIANVLDAKKWSRLNADLYCKHQIQVDGKSLIITTRKGDRSDSIYGQGQSKPENFNKERRRVELEYNKKILPKDDITFEFEVRLIDTGDFLRVGYQYPIWYIMQIKESHDIHVDGQTPIVQMVSVDPYSGIVSNGVVLQKKKDFGQWLKVKVEVKLDRKSGYERIFANDVLITERKPHIHNFIRKEVYKLKFGQYFTQVRTKSENETKVEFRNIKIKTN